QAKAAPVEVIDGYDVVTTVEQLQEGRRSRHARCKRKAARPALQGSHAALVGEPGGAMRSRVLEPLTDTRARLSVGRGGVDGRHHGAGAGIRRLTSVY